VFYALIIARDYKGTPGLSKVSVDDDSDAES